MTLSELLKQLKIAVVPSGFRSSFRDRAVEETNHPPEVIEAALVHVVQNKVEAVYARSDLSERRRPFLLPDHGLVPDHDVSTPIASNSAPICTSRHTGRGV